MARMPPLNALKCFEAAARARSFSRAADELHVTQSAVSHQIRLLEDWFGVPLFERRGRQTDPTPKGEELARALAEAFAIMATACRRIGQPDSAPVLTVAALPSIATIWLIPRLSGFQAAHPEIPLKVVYAFHGRPFAIDDVDVAILWGTGEGADGRYTRFLDGDTVAVANAGFIQRVGPLDSPQMLLGAPLLHDTNRHGWQVWMRAAGLKHAGPSPGPIFEDFNLLRAAALAGQGVALCPRSLIATDLAAGRLVQLFDTAIMQDHAYYLVEPEDESHKHATAIATFKSWLLASAKGAVE